MRPQACLQLLTPLLNQPSFTSKEAKILGVPAEVLSYYVKTGKLKRIRRGVYQAIDYQNPEAFRWVDLIEAVHSINGGVVCLISALAVYDLTEEIPVNIGLEFDMRLQLEAAVKLRSFAFVTSIQAKSKSN
jgi:predicted transcriptional regulator of viral defense system